MDRRRVFWVAVIISAFALMYGVSFGPVTYLEIKAVDNGIVSLDQIESFDGAAFYPHFWACYHSEHYFEYLGWCSEGRWYSYPWPEFREMFADHVGE
ncbi:MAG TPA: hypothetical protein VHX44_17525 [Planctomycetota bacterium]|nr:hypothetical protein [Planctomycetota bacterium]